MSHVCEGDTIDETHDCTCDIGRNHSAAYHRQVMRERRELDRELEALLASDA